MSNKITEKTSKIKGKGQSRHNYLNTQKSNVHTKINGNLVQLWFGNIVGNLMSVKDFNKYLDKQTKVNDVGKVTKEVALRKPITRKSFTFNSIDKGTGLAALTLSSVFAANLSYAAPQSITGIMTDYNVFTQSTSDSLNDGNDGNDDPMDVANNLLAFTVNGATFSTGVNDAELTAQSVTYTPANYAALEPALALSGNAGQGSQDDGDANNLISPLYPMPLITPSNYDVSAYLTDGVQGLGMSTFANNMGGTFIFDLTNVDQSTLGDGVPDFLYFNSSRPDSSGVDYKLYDSDGNQVGNTVTKRGNRNNNLNIAVVINDRFLGTGVATARNRREIIQAFSIELADFGITQDQLGTLVTRLVIDLPPQADPPFLAYNTDAFVAVDPLKIVIQITEDTNDDGVIGGSELSGNVDVKVTIPTGAAETNILTITDGTTSTPYVLTALEISNGFITASYPPPPFGSTLSVNAKLTDSSDTPLSSASDSALISVPTLNIDTPIEIDNIVNQSEAGDVTITGTTSGVEDGRSVTVTISDGSNPDVITTGIVASNTWTATDVDISSLNQGNITVVANVSNVAGDNANDNETLLLEKPPTIVISTDATVLIAGESATITFTLSEDSTDFTESDVAVAGGTLSNFTGSGSSYSATFTPTADSTTPASVSVASATFTDAAGNTNTDGSAVNMSIDTTVPSIPTVVINDGGDELLSAAEIAAGVTATITTPADSVAGDTLTVDTNGDGSADHTIVLTGVQAAGGSVDINVDPAHVPADGILTVSAEVTDPAGNEGSSGTDTSTGDSTAAGAPTVVINDGGDELLSVAEIAAGVTATITTPADSVAGDTLTVDTNGDGSADHTIVLTGVQAAGGTVDINVDPAHVPADGILTVSAEVTDPAGNEGSSGTDTSTGDSTAAGAPTVVINDGGDELLSAAEIAAGVSATITTPADSVAGDTLTVDTNGDGSADHTIVLTGVQAAGGSVDINVDPAHVPADGILTVSAEVTDPAGNEGSSGTDTSTGDSTAAGAPTVVINDGGDELLSVAEIAAGVTATITTPADSVAGDTLTVDTNGDGSADHTIVLTGVQAAGGSVDINVDPAHVPADGILTVSAEVTDPAGNEGSSGTDTSTGDSTAAGAPTVVINDGGDELLSAAEIAAGVSATITTPADSVAGDTLTVDTNGDGSADHTIVLTGVQAAGGSVDINVDPAHVPADGILTVSAEVTDPAGNEGSSGTDTSTGDSTAAGAPTVVINDGGDELLSAAEIAAGVTATITTPADSVAGDTLTVDTNGDGSADHTIVLTGVQAAGGSVDINVDPAHVPADGILTVSAEVTDPAGNEGSSGTDTSTGDSTAAGAPTVVINDGGDELLSVVEVAAGVTATITTPADSVAGDTLTVDTDGDGSADHTIVLTGVQAAGGSVDINVDPAHVPADGILTVSAEVTDPAGNEGSSGTDTSTGDSTAAGAPTVVINDGGDELLSAAEIAAGVSATITTPADSVAGDTLTVDTDGDGSADHTIVLTGVQAAGGSVDINVDPAHVPADGILTVSAEVTDPAGNEGSSGTDTSTGDSTAAGAPTVVINDGGDELLSAAEIAAGVSATITTPADSVAGDTLTVDTNGDGSADHTIVLTGVQAAGGSVDINVDPAHVPADGILTVSAEVTDPVGNEGSSGTDTSTGDSTAAGAPTVVINDGGDELLSVVEVAAGVTATITTPADSVAGDTLTVDTDGDGSADHTIVLTGVQAAGGSVDINVDPAHVPADGILTVSAEVTDPAGNEGSSGTDTSTGDSTAAGAPTVVINDGGDELLSAAEIAAGVTATITTPADSVAGDTLTVDTDGDGSADHTIVLTGVQAAGGSVDINVDPAHVPADGILTVSAEVTDPAGNEGSSGTDTSTGDSTAAGAPTVVINDGGDELLSVAEIAAGVTATITTPADSVAGDTLTVDTDGDGSADHTIVLTGVQAAGGSVDINVDPAHVPADGILTVSAEVTDPAGNEGSSGTDTSTGDSTAAGAPTVVINDGGDELLSVAEIAAGVSATITTPADSVAGDTLTVDTNGDGSADHTIVLTGVQAAGGSVDINVDPAHVPADGILTVSAEVTDPVGNEGSSGTDTSTGDSTAAGAPTVVINDGGDELLSVVEVAAGVTATITTPADSVAGDTLTVDTNGDGSADHTIVLTGVQAAGGSVDINVDPAHVPADGILTVSAEVTDPAGNEGSSGTDTSTGDSTAAGAPTVVINDGGDELLSAAEIAAGVTATITTPADSVAGDTLTVDTNGDGSADHTIVLTGVQAAGGTVDINVDPAHVPADGILTVSAEVTDPAGNEGSSGTDTSTGDSTAAGAPTVVINDGGDELLSVAEIAAGVSATITTPADSVAGDTLTVDTNGDGSADHTIVLTGVQAAGGSVDINVDPAHVPADGILTVSAEVTDPAGNEGSSGTDTSTGDSTAAGAPTVVINDGGDELLSAAEIAAGVSATITTPADSVAGDTLTVDTNGDGIADHTIVLTGVQAAGGSVDINVDPAHVPADGILTVSAEVTDPVGNEGSSGTDTSTGDSTAAGAPTVVINDGGDELLSVVEVAAGVSATITTPADSVAGDTLTVDTNGDGSADHTIVLTGVQAAGGSVDINVDPAHVPADGILTVSAEVTDPAGNEGSSGTDTSTGDSTAAGAPTVVINDGGDELLSAVEVAAGVSATITTPADSVAGDTLTVDTNGDGSADHTIVLTGVQAAGGTVDINVDPAHVPADGILTVSAEVTDPVGNEGSSGTDTSTGDSTAAGAPTVVINDGGDELLSVAEIAAGVSATITTPADSVAGDTLTVDTNGDGSADHTIVLTGVQAAGGSVDINVDPAHVPADGILTVSAEVTDPAGNEGSSGTDTSTGDSTAAGAPTVVINDGGDELLSVAEIAAGVSATITTPADSVAGDTLTVDTNGDGSADHTIVLTGVQAAGGSVDINVDPAHVPADGILTVSAEVTDPAGNEGSSGTDTSTGDSTAAGAPTVVINDGGDELLSAAEIAAGVSATITTPADSVAGDTLTVDTNGDGSADHTIVLTGVQAAGGSVDINVDPAHVPADGILTVSAEVTDPAGNEGSSGTDTSTGDSTAAGAPTVVINDGGDELLSVAEIAAGVSATITTPADSVAGDTLTVDTNGDGSADHTIVLTGVQAAGGTVDINVDPAHVPADGILTVSAEVTDPAGNEGSSGTDTSTGDSTAAGALTVVINDGGDELLSAAEIAAGVTATITTPVDSVAGDTLTVDTNGDGSADHTIVLTGVQAAGGTVDVTVAPAHVPADGILTVSAEVTDPAGNEGSSGTDTSTADSALPLLTAEDIGPVSDTTPILSGTSDQPDGSTVTVKDEDGNTVCTATVTSGEWNCESTVVLPYATNNLIAEIENPAGNSITAEFTAEIEIDTDNDGLVNSQDLDDDNDGIPDLVEEAGTPDLDSDGDGIPNTIDLDSDNDGILDIIEAGGIDTDNNGIVDNDDDADNDGLADVVDANPNTTDTPTNATEAADIASLPNTDTDGDGSPDIHDLDSDGDGISDLIEGGVTPSLDANNDGTLDTITDTDGDGISDIIDSDSGNTPPVVLDTDNDGTPNYQDLDSDNDGLNDVSEAGSTDEDGDGAIDIPNSLVDGNDLPDTDGDGVIDVLEPNNPNLPASIDSDGDGVIDNITDTDGDGVPDVADIIPTSFGVLLDTDKDRVPNIIDIDDDYDGIPDIIEQNSAQNGGDTDGDGIPDELDMDSDSDGIRDFHENGLTVEQLALLDTNHDGVIDGPVGLNGLADSIETDDTESAGMDLNGDGTVDETQDTDLDGIPDYQDLDSDNDGIFDLHERGNRNTGNNASNLIIPSQVDTNNDGVVDDFTSDVDGDGIATSIDDNDNFRGGATDIPVDIDNDGFADYRDLDSDGDGISDLSEGRGVDPDTADVNDDGVLDNPNVDSDGDGIPDSGDTNPTGFGSPQASVSSDIDGDGIPDYRDLDSDNDGISDVLEAGYIDTNNDGIIDSGETGLQKSKDSDGDGIPDYRDLDSDGDGVFDITLSPNFNLDTNNDGVIDDVTDTDDDGIPDINDRQPESHGTGGNDAVGHLDTAVSGSGGSTGPLSALMLMLLLAFRRFGGMKLLKRFLPMLLVAFFIVPSMMPNTAMADDQMSVSNIPEYQERNYLEIVDSMSDSQKEDEIHKRRCSTGLIVDNHYRDFTTCNYVMGGYVMTHVDPEGEAGGFSTSDNSSNGFNVVLGHHFKPRWFGELSYTDMGDATVSNINPLIGDETISYKVPSLHLGYLLRAPENRLNFYVKGGVSAISNKASSDTVPYEKITNVQATFGLGAQWQPSKESGLFVRVGVDFFDRDAISAGINIGYKFKGTTKLYRPVK